MSWIVQSYLNSRDTIRSNADINSDSFNDLIIIEKAIETLQKMGALTEDDLYVIGITVDGYNKIDKPTRVERHTLAKRRAIVCDRIAYYLGGYFTDEGYLDYIQKKYKFDADKMTALRAFIKSRNKHRIIRKGLIHDKKPEIVRA